MEIKERIIKKTNRHIARTLSHLDLAGISPELKGEVKSGFWNLCDDILEILGIETELKKAGKESA